MVLATTPFAHLAAASAKNLGLPDARIVAVPHPLGGTDEETVIAWAEAAVDGIIEALER
ncbi:MAG: hypothetical protein H8E59_01510 [Actinobacteria bacterium]|nr:hypothetical protein [Actinomycetota bacterium]